MLHVRGRRLNISARNTHEIVAQRRRTFAMVREYACAWRQKWRIKEIWLHVFRSLRTQRFVFALFGTFFWRHRGYPWHSCAAAAAAAAVSVHGASVFPPSRSSVISLPLGPPTSPANREKIERFIGAAVRAPQTNGRQTVFITRRGEFGEGGMGGNDLPIGRLKPSAAVVSGKKAFFNYSAILKAFAGQISGTANVC